MAIMSQEANRLNGVSFETPPAPRRTSRRTPSRTTKPARKSTRKPAKPDHLRRWALAYVGIAGLMSCGLNALANAEHAPPQYKLAAWAMGAIVPVLVLLGFRTAGCIYRRGYTRPAAALAAVCCAVLGLSVFHCEQSIAMLTGSNHVLASLLAIGIDCGLVGCEAAAMLDDEGA